MQTREKTPPDKPHWPVLALIAFAVATLFIFLVGIPRLARAEECSYEGPVIMALGEDGYGPTVGPSFAGNGCGIEVTRGRLGNPFLAEEEEEGGFNMDYRLKFHLEEGLVDLVHHGEVNAGIEILFPFPLFD